MAELKLGDVQVAAAVGVAVSTVIRWLAGSDPRWTHIVKLARAFPRFGELIGLEVKTDADEAAA